MNKNACASVCPSPSPTSLKLFTFCFYIGKNTYQELVRMLYVLLASLDRFHPDFFLVVYHNLGITIDDPRVRMVSGFRPPATGLVCEVSGKSAVYIDCQSKLTGGFRPPATGW